MKAIFIQGAFKNTQGILWKIQGLFKGHPTLFQFSKAFQGSCEPRLKVSMQCLD